MGFRFRYQTLQDYRERLKEGAEIALLHAQSRLREARDALDGARRSYQDGVEAFEAKLKRGTTGDEIRNYRDFLSGMQHRIRAVERDIEKREETVRKEIEEVKEKTRELKIIEKLREKDMKKWKHEQLQKEQKWLNEIAVTRHGRDFF